MTRLFIWETDSEETARKFVSNINCFYSWLEKYVPVDMSLELSGKYYMGQGQNEILNNYLHIYGLPSVTFSLR